MKAYGYIRVSELRPGEDKYSPDAQRQRIENESKRRGLKLDRVFEDLDVNSASISRNGTWHMLAEVVKPGDTVIFNELTRVGRKTQETLSRIEDLVSRGINIVSLDLPYDPSGYMGQFITTILAAGAQMENQQRGERVRQAQIPLAEAGKWVGGNLPFGYRHRDPEKKDYTIEADPEHAQYVRDIFSWWIAGNSAAAITKRLYAAGCRTRKGNTIKPYAIHRIISHRAYIGEREYAGKIYKMNIPHLVDRDIWESAQALKTTRGRPWPKKVYLLSGMMECSKCGGLMIHVPKGKHRKAHSYGCLQWKIGCGCKGVFVFEHLAESAVLEALFAHVDRAAYRREVEAYEFQERQAPGISTLKRKLTANRRKQGRLLDLYANENIDQVQLEEKTAPLLAEARTLDGEIERLEAGVRLPPQWEGVLEEDWKDLNLDEQRQALRIFVERIIVHPGWGKDRVEIIWR